MDDKISLKRRWKSWRYLKYCQQNRRKIERLKRRIEKRSKGSSSLLREIMVFVLEVILALLITLLLSAAAFALTGHY